MRPEARVEVLFSAAEIQARVEVLADRIAADLGAEPMVVAILKGSFVFTADLMRALHHHGAHPQIDFLTLSSYGSGTESRGEVTVVRDIADDVGGREVLLVDDILESGRTLAFARQHLSASGAARVRLCVLLHKPGKRKAEIEADYIGFETPDLFVVGYGLDYAHYYRELPYIGIIDRQ
jgi:hypoxanthine phosphoribosyltransferase